MKPFIVFTTGRAGSTALMDKLASYPDIGVPNKQVDCRDNELLHPQFIERYKHYYQEYLDQPIRSEIGLISAFFRANQDRAYAGFKSMVNRHQYLEALTGSGEIQVITLRRADLAATVASFIVATRAGTWRRNGGPQPHKLFFDTQLRQQALAHLKYITRSIRVMCELPGTIQLVYEDLCGTDFVSDELNDYFGRSIQLEYPKAPINPADYVDNWLEFKTFIEDNLS